MTLTTLTGHESGIVVYADGTAVALNWGRLAGLPTRIGRHWVSMAPVPDDMVRTSWRALPLAIRARAVDAARDAWRDTGYRHPIGRDARCWVSADRAVVVIAPMLWH
jgi:hypothetical protein